MAHPGFGIPIMILALGAKKNTVRIATRYSLANYRAKKAKKCVKEHQTMTSIWVLARPSPAFPGFPGHGAAMWGGSDYCPTRAGPRMALAWHDQTPSNYY